MTRPCQISCMLTIKPTAEVGRRSLAVALLVTLAGCGGGGIEGTWMGTAVGGEPVTYAFAGNGSGFRDVGGRVE